MHQKNYISAGKKLIEADKALIMLHGRGASAEDILRLSPHLQVTDYAIIAPQATDNTWYPYSFLAAREQNEPWLTSALEVIDDLVNELNNAGIPNDKIYFLGFSQGACLTLEYVARKAQRWGGVVAFTGGLIGETLDPQLYAGNFDDTPIFIGTSDPDSHVPVERVESSAALLESFHASVTLKVYPNMGHTIAQDEIELANRLILTSN